MIIAQAPLRVSLFGGGTDFREFFLREGGAVLSVAIDKYVYVIVKERFDDKIYLNYSRKEIVDAVDEIQHDLIRETMRKTGVRSGVEVTTLADVPSEGSGLGSSSSITVALLEAFYTYTGEKVTRDRLAREACEIEIDILRRPIGIQDQFIAAYGDMRFFEFRPDGSLNVEKLDVPESLKRHLVSNLLLFFTGRTRASVDVLSEQRRNIPERLPELRRLRDMAYRARGFILEGALDELGFMLHESWEEKKRLASNISDSHLDEICDRAMKTGALGGKIVGAGSGGFLLLYCAKERQDAVRRAMQGLRELPFMLSRDGAKVIFDVGSYNWR